MKPRPRSLTSVALLAAQLLTVGLLLALSGCSEIIDGLVGPHDPLSKNVMSPMSGVASGDNLTWLVNAGLGDTVNLSVIVRTRGPLKVLPSALTRWSEVSADSSYWIQFLSASAQSDAQGVSLARVVIYGTGFQVATVGVTSSDAPNVYFLITQTGHK